jgi:hypothetical protein
MGGQAMTEYRIVEAYRKIWIEKKLMGDTWIKVDIKDVPKYHDSLADARSWVATIKRGVVYHDAEAPPLSESDLQWECARDFRIFRNHDAEDAPNLAQDERKVQDDTPDSIKPLEWFEAKIGSEIRRSDGIALMVWDEYIARYFWAGQTKTAYRYATCVDHNPQ